jgi:hypothetical protein
MFDLTNPSIDGTAYLNPYAPTAYNPSSTFLFNLPNSTNDEQQQRLTDYSSYPNTTQDLM